MTNLPNTILPSGERVIMLGQGTWRMGENRSKRAEEVSALRLGIDLGMTLIDTAEMYGEGGAEEVVAEAISGRRREVFIVSKCYPHNAGREKMKTACNNSLERLRIDCLDLYLLHWRGSIPIAETVESFEALIEAGKIRAWGVSNFDVGDMKELTALTGGGAVATNQVLYNLTRRSVEFELLPYCLKRKVPLMAYSPVEQGRLLKNKTLKRIAARHNASAAQIALSWLLRREGVITIPKASQLDHVRENRAAVDLPLSKEDLAELDKAFPPPDRAVPLEML